MPDNRTYIAPAITFKPNDSTKLTILGEYMDSKTGGSAAYDNTYGTFSLRDGTVIFRRKVGPARANPFMDKGLDRSRTRIMSRVERAVDQIVSDLAGAS